MKAKIISSASCVSSIAAVSLILNFKFICVYLCYCWCHMSSEDTFNTLSRGGFGRTTQPSPSPGTLEIQCQQCNHTITPASGTTNYCLMMDPNPTLCNEESTLILLPSLFQWLQTLHHLASEPMLLHSLASIPAVWKPTHHQGSKFVLTANVQDEDMLDINIFLCKEEYGVAGSSKYCKNKALPTALLSKKFCVAHHNVSHISDREEGDQSHTQQVQQVIFRFLHRIHEGHQHSKAMDFMNICLVVKLDGNLERNNCYDGGTTPKWIFGPTGILVMITRSWPSSILSTSIFPLRIVLLVIGSRSLSMLLPLTFSIKLSTRGTASSLWIAWWCRLSSLHNVWDVPYVLWDQASYIDLYWLL